MSVVAFNPALDFQPLYPDQTEDVILARWVDWANEGLDPVADADIWVDTREGGHWRTCEVPAVREFARVYDLIGSEVPMSGFVLWSWGTYLDDLAAVWDVVRLPATPATGSERFSGPVGSVISAGTRLSVSPSTPDDPAPSFETTVGGAIGAGGTLDLAITAVDAGSVGNVAALAITVPESTLPSGVTVSNPLPTANGTDVETDESLRSRLLEEIAGKGPGAVHDYIRWARAYPGVGRVNVLPVWNGPGTVMVVVSDPSGEPLSTALVSGFQNQLDPTAGQGHGIAPVGASVTVETSTLLNLDYTATLVYEPGYSWNGAAGTIAVGPGIQNALAAYSLTVPPGGEVVYEHAKGIVATFPGVHDVTAFTINAGTVNVAVAAGTTPQAAVFHTFTAS